MCFFHPFPLLAVMYVRQKPPLTFHIQAILISTQTMVDRLFSSAPTRSTPRPSPNTFIHVCITRGHADAMRLYAGIGSINTGVYRYSSPLSGFFSPMELAWTWTDAALLLAGADAEPRPRLRHVTAADFLTSASTACQCEDRLQPLYQWLLITFILSK